MDLNNLSLINKLTNIIDKANNNMAKAIDIATDKMVEQEQVIDRVLIKDKYDDYYDVYIFEKGQDITISKVLMVINLVKDLKQGEWTLEDIAKTMKTMFKVETIMIFDYESDTVIDIND